VIVCLDANILIYYIERHPIWEPRVAARLKALAALGLRWRVDRLRWYLFRMNHETAPLGSYPNGVIREG
jgi:hypothetical protein